MMVVPTPRRNMAVVLRRCTVVMCIYVAAIANIATALATALATAMATAMATP